MNGLSFRQQNTLRDRLGSAAGKFLDLIYPENLYCLCCEDTMPQDRIHGICDR